MEVPYPSKWWGLLSLLFRPVSSGRKQRTTGLQRAFWIQAASFSFWGFPGGSMAKNLPAKAKGAGNWDSNPGLGRSPGEGNGNPFPYSCLENPMDRGVWRATVHSRVRHDRATEHQHLLFLPHKRWFLWVWPLAPPLTYTSWLGSVLLWASTTHEYRALGATCLPGFTWKDQRFVKPSQSTMEASLPPHRPASFSEFPPKQWHPTHPPFLKSQIWQLPLSLPLLSPRFTGWMCFPKHLPEAAFLWSKLSLFLTQVLSGIFLSLSQRWEYLDFKVSQNLIYLSLTQLPFLHFSNSDFILQRYQTTQSLSDSTRTHVPFAQTPYSPLCPSYFSSCSLHFPWGFFLACAKQMPLCFYCTWHFSTLILLPQDTGCPFSHSLIASTHIHWLDAGGEVGSWTHMIPAPRENDVCNCLRVWLHMPLWSDWWSCFHVPPGLTLVVPLAWNTLLSVCTTGSFLLRLSGVSS